MERFLPRSVALSLSIAVGAALLPQMSAAQVLPTPPCPPLSTGHMKPLPPGRHSITIALPKNVDPRGCLFRVESGTRVYKRFEQSVSYADRGRDGKPVYTNTSLDGLVSSHSKTGSALVIRTDTGSVFSFPIDTVVHPPDKDNFSLIFVKRGDTLPTGLQVIQAKNGKVLVPDFVVP